MENLKIRVNNEAESKEVQELFFELGYKWFSGGNQVQHLKQSCSSSFGYLVAWSSVCFTDVIQCGCGNEDAKEITLPELRDLVVLKRNDATDCTHWHVTGQANLPYLFAMDEWYFFGRNGWEKSTHTHEFYNRLKPIEKPMKEYLRKNSNGTYSYIGTVRPEHVSDFMIEIPEGATYYAKDASLGKSGNFFFRLRSDDFDFEAVWLESNWIQAIFNVENQDVLWQRNNNQTIASAVESSHPEELPFIDDEPLQSLNDQYAEIEKVRQDSINSPNHYADSTIECIDAMEAMMTPEQFIGYLRGNVFKYQWKYEKKNGIEDLKKAQWYLDKLTVKVAEKNAPF